MTSRPACPTSPTSLICPVGWGDVWIFGVCARVVGVASDCGLDPLRVEELAPDVGAQRQDSCDGPSPDHHSERGDNVVLRDVPHELDDVSSAPPVDEH